MSWCRSARPAGSASVGTQSQGQGHETVFAQILAASLGVPMDCIEVRQGDTRTIPHGGGTGGSSSTIISGTTLKRAADVVIQRGRDLAAERPGDRAGRHRLIATAASRSSAPTGASACSSWRPASRSPGDALFGDKIESFPTGVMVCEVEVDPETGEVRVDRLTEVADCGTVVNPRLLAGQVHGGIVHGLGNALMEEGGLRRGEPASC